MASNSHTELEGGVMGLFVLTNTTFLVYKPQQQVVVNLQAWAFKWVAIAMLN